MLRSNSNISLHAMYIPVLLGIRRRFRLRYSKKTYGTAAQNAEVIEKRTVLRRRIAALREIQAIYMPCVPMLAARREQVLLQKRRQTAPHATQAPFAIEDVRELPEDQVLFLPHQLDMNDLDQCTAGLPEIEERLRDAQLRDALDKLRVQLHVKSRIMAFKDRNIRHQKYNLRARKQLDTNDAKIKVFTEKYRAAWLAKLALAGEGDWMKTWRKLENADIQTLAKKGRSNQRKGRTI